MKSRLRFLTPFLLAALLLGGTVPAQAAAETCRAVFSEFSAPAAPFDRVDYYIDKLREAKELDASAPFAVALRGLIMTTTRKIEKIVVPLESLYLIHPITRGASLEKLEKRVQALTELQLPEDRTLRSDVLAEVIPSKNPLRVIRASNNQYVVFDGNGRLVALQKAFEKKDVKIEVELYRSNSKLLQKVLRRVRTMRGVMPPQ